MAKRTVKSRKRATAKRSSARPKATGKSTTKKRTTTKKRGTPKAKAGRKSTTKKRTKTRKTTTPKAAGKSTSRKRTTTGKTATPKATRKRTTTGKAATPKATRKRTTTGKTATPKATRKRVTTRKSATPKATRKRATTRKSATPKATRKRTTTRKSATPKATRKRTTTRKSATPKATRKRTTTRKSATPKATRKRATTRKTATPKATRKSTARKRTSTRKTATPKATRKRTATRKTATPKATRKSTSRKRTTTRKTATPRAARKSKRKVAQSNRPVRHKSEFDFNAWLLPRLELEQYELCVEPETGVKDDIKGSTRYAWIGAGQCGGRLVQSFYDLGYRKVLAINTTHHDLDLLDIPQEQKFLMDIGSKGAGKDMGRGKNAVLQYQQEILHLTRQTFGSEVDHVMVCVGAGGGTGGGSAADLIEIAKRYTRYIGITEPDKRVGVIMTLPAVGEASSPKVAENAWKLATELSEMAAARQISPLIFIDNDKINKMYHGMTVKSFWPSINSTVAGLFDIFNRLSDLSSRYTSFDPVDYHSIMEAGGCAIMGLTTVRNYEDRFAISNAVKTNLKKTLLAGGFDLSTAKIAGCIVVAGRKIIESVGGLQENIDYAFDNLSEITGDATIHRGIYEDGRNCLRVYTIIGGLDTCTSRLQELRSRVPARMR